MTRVQLWTCVFIALSLFTGGESQCFDRDPLSDVGIIFRSYSTDSSRYEEFTSTNTVPGNYKGSRRTVFLIHGYNEGINARWYPDMKDALLDRERVNGLNVILVGWPDGAGALDYYVSASTTQTVGELVDALISTFVGNAGASRDDMHCIGFSLGAHSCGQVGSNNRIGRITGLDPAGLAFGSNNLNCGLHQGAANQVDVIHTDGQPQGALPFYGQMRKRGHIDFYPNDGGKQAGCLTRSLSDHRSKRQIDVACSHGRAHVLMTHTIKNSNSCRAEGRCSNENNIPGSCSSCGESCPSMGYDASGSGLYALDTASSGNWC